MCTNVLGKVQTSYFVDQIQFAYKKILISQTLRSGFGNPALFVMFRVHDFEAEFPMSCPPFPLPPLLNKTNGAGRYRHSRQKN